MTTDDKAHPERDERAERIKRDRDARAERIKREFGERLLQLRKDTGEAQDKFALQKNLDRSWFAKAERGEISVSLVNLDRIAQALDLTLSELLQGIGDD